MRRFLSRFNKRQIIIVAIMIFSLLLFAGLTVYNNIRIKSLSDQQMVSRWSSEGGFAQISCFFDGNAKVEEFSLKNFEHQLDQLLLQDSITNTSDNDSARLWEDAYSGTGSVTVKSDKSSATVNAIGVSGDYFSFHPLDLVSGTYFNDDYIMQDYVIIDEETAWQLFGSSSVAGMEITIGGIPHVIIGVYHREQDYLSKAAGLDSSTIYLSYTSLVQYGTSNGISVYEIVMPNPISGYAKEMVNKNLGVDTSLYSSVENSDRYSLFSTFKNIAGLSKRSIRTDSVAYPFYENIARFYEDQLAVVMIFRIIFLFIPILILVYFLIYLWRHKKWDKQDVKNRFEQLGNWMIKRIRTGFKKIFHGKKSA